MAKDTGGVRIRVCHLPVKAPWLNPIEPKWVHALPNAECVRCELMNRSPKAA